LANRGEIITERFVRALQSDSKEACGIHTKWDSIRRAHHGAGGKAVLNKIGEGLYRRGGRLVAAELMTLFCIAASKRVHMIL
jgi:hypothetical protein